ncbi:MAG: hypothetical protein CMO01_02140, partial [Thalassobius sp.]|nr:hypothetical protein [Thalassovita sp.]
MFSIVHVYGQGDFQVNSGSSESGCGPLVVGFEPLPDGAKTLRTSNPYEWDLGNGTNSILETPSTIYISNGTYDVSLTIYYNDGTSETIDKNDFITVFAGPTPTFSSDIQGGCSPLTVTFYSDITIGDAGIDPGNIIWEFGSGGVAIGDTVTYTFNDPGLYDVKLFVEDNNGCKNTYVVSDFINVIDQLDVDFTPEEQITCSSSILVNFTDSTKTTATGPFLYEWDFDGDGISDSNLQNPSYTFNRTGDSTIYDVTLTVTDIPSGCSNTEVKTGVVKLYDYQQSFTVNQTESCSPMTVLFTDDSNVQFPFQTIEWDFDGDGVYDDSGSSAFFTYTNTGNSPQTYTVSMRVTGGDGTCGGVVTQTDFITVHPEINAVMSADRTQFCTSSFTVDFDGSASENGTIYRWDFDGDGSVDDTNADPAPFTYSGYGTYTAELEIENSQGCIDRTTMTIRSEPIVPDFSPDVIEGCNSLTTTFTNNTTTFVPVTNWDWVVTDEGGNVVATSNQENPTFNISGEGIYSVSLTASNSECSESVTQSDILHIGLPPTNLDFTPDQFVVCNNMEIIFTNNSTVVSSYPVEFIWDFDYDGTTLDEDLITSNVSDVATHTYSNRIPGPVTVALGYRSNGCEYILSSQVFTQTIDIQAPVANYTDVTDECYPDTLRLFDASVGDDTRVWTITDYLGNIFTSSDEDLVLTFEPGTDVDVQLEVSNFATGCSDIELRTITMPPALQYFNTSVSDTTICVDNSITFNTGVIGAASYTWYIGDTIRYEQNPTVLFTTPGAYDTRLEIDFGNGCIKDTTITAFIDIIGPEVQIQANTALSGCAPLSIELEDISTAPSPIVNRTWSVDGVPTGTGTVFNYTFDRAKVPQTNTYQVSLTVETDDGCVSTRYVEVNPYGPQPDFLIDSVRTCDEIIVNFEAIEVDSTGIGPLTFNWSTDAPGVTLGSGLTVSDTFPDGTHNVTLEVIDAYGCTNTITKSIDVMFGPALQAGFVAIPNTFNCPPAAISFADTSISAPTVTIVSWLWNFGDGTFSTLQNPGKIYNHPSDYDVSLTVMDDLGCISTILVEDVVQVDGPVGTFTVAETIGVVERMGYVPLPVEYTGTSDTTANQYGWETGDGTFLSFGAAGDSTASYTYTTAGTYTPKMILTYDGCQYAPPTSLQVTVLPCPTVAISDQKYCVSEGDQTISAFNSSQNITLGTMHYRWYKNGSGTAFASDVDEITVTAPSGITADQVDTYTVEIWVEDGSDIVCQSSDDFTVTYSPNPVADFEFSGDQVCFTAGGVTVSFTNKSTSPGTTVIQRIEYDFDYDGSNFTVDQTVNSPSFNQVTNHTYTSAGTYYVALRAYSDNGCDDQAETPIPVIIYPLPEPDFNVSGSCDGDAISFTDNSSILFGTVDFYEWDFDNDNTFEETGASLSSLDHTFPGPGIYPVTLRLTSDQSCQDEVTENVNVHPTPVAAITTSTGSAKCFGNAIDFDASASSITGRFATANGSDLGYTPSISNYHWDFDGDGTFDQTTSSATVSYLYPAPGNYTARVRTESNRGCIDEATMSITIYYLPVATFSVSNTCLDQAITFDATSATTASSTDGVTITNYEWDLSYDGAFNVDISGDVTTAETVQNTYSTPGEYTIALRVTSSDNCQAFYTSDISIPSVTPDFTYFNVCDGATINLYDNSSKPDTLSIVSYSWDFDGDGTIDKTGLNTDYQYDISDFPELASLSSGDSVVILTDARLTIETSDGCSYTVSKEIVVKDVVIPIPDFDITKVCEGFPTTLDASNSDPGDPAYTITDYDWDLDNDGTFDSSGVSLAYTFPSAGTYPVTLRIITNIGCSMTITKDVVIDTYPNIDFNYNSGNICNGDLVTFNDASDNAGGSAVTQFFWDFDNDGVFEASGSTSDYTFPGAGSFIVNHKIITSLGCERISSETVVINPNPIALFGADTVCLGANTSFTDLSTIENDVNGLPIAGNSITNWSWDFGDGNSSTSANPFHSYSAPGNYSVTLTVTTDKGCSHDYTDSVRVNPSIDDDLSVTEVCLSEATEFTDASVIDMSSYVALGSESYSIDKRTWNFGDGSGDYTGTGNEQLVSHTYANPGNYTATLTMETSTNCELVVTIPVRVNPSIDDDLSVTEVCLSEATEFTDASVIDMSSYVDLGSESYSIDKRTWNFGDGSGDYTGTGNEQLVSHTYANPGNYTATLTMETSTNCELVVTIPVRVNPNSTASFSADPVCFGSATEFIDASFIDLSSYVNGSGDVQEIVTWSWDFGDTNTS